MIILIACIFILLPIFIAPVVAIIYFRDDRYTAASSLLIALTLGLIAYNFSPPTSFDLYRHHQAVEGLMKMSINQAGNLIATSYEPLAVAINFLVAKSKNVNLLQLSTVTCGYWIIFFMLKDYAKKYRVKATPLALTLLFTISSLTYINYISGIWNYLAMIIFAFAFYLESQPNKNRIVIYAMYLATPLIHSSMFLPLILLFLFKLCGERLGKRLFIAIGIIFASLPLIPPVVSSLSGFTIFSQLEPMYQAYFASGPRFYNLYAGNVLVMETLKASVYIAIVLLTYKKASIEAKRVSSFILLLLAAIVTYAPVSIAATRFILLVQLLGFPILMDYLSSKNTYIKLTLVCIILLLSMVFITYQYLTLRGLDFHGLVPFGLVSNVMSILSRTNY